MVVKNDFPEVLLKVLRWYPLNDIGLPGLSDMVLIQWLMTATTDCRFSV